MNNGNGDAFPNDPSETSDSDGRGVGDDAEWYDEDDARIEIKIQHYEEGGTADFWTYGDLFFAIKVDFDTDGV